jgi:Spy/CpxP family protein refolding chaperone
MATCGGLRRRGDFLRREFFVQSTTSYWRSTSTPKDRASAIGPFGFCCGAVHFLEKGPKMKSRKLFTRMTTGVAVLGMALCVPAAMLAQDTAPAPPPQASTDQQPSPGSQPMRHGQPPSPERQLSHLTKMLNLTQDQQQQMLPILQDQQKQMDTIHNNTALSPQQRHQQMRATMMDTHQKLEALMTDTQKQQFEQAMQQRRDHMRNGGMAPGEGAGTPPPPNGQNAPPPPPQ